MSMMSQTEFLSSEISKEEARGKGRDAASILSPAGYLICDLRQVGFPSLTSVSPLLQLISMMEDMGFFKFNFLKYFILF